MARHSLSGKLVPGLGEGAGFTRKDWARRQFVDLLGIDPYPGTLNLVVEDEADLKTWRAIRERAGLTVVPPDPGWCNGTCYPAMVAGTIKGAIVVPEVADYPADKIEIIAATGLREALGLGDGDTVTLEVET